MGLDKGGEGVALQRDVILAIQQLAKIEYKCVRDVKFLLVDRAKALFGNGLENFPTTAFEDDSKPNKCGDYEIVEAKGIKIGHTDRRFGGIFSDYDKGAVWQANNEDLILVFCPQGLLLHDWSNELGEPLLHKAKDAPEILYLIFGKAILRAVEEAYSKQTPR